MITRQVEILNWINLLMKLILNSKYCVDFIKWIPCSNLDNVKYLTNGGNSKVYFGTWNLLLNIPLVSIDFKLIIFQSCFKSH